MEMRRRLIAGTWRNMITRAYLFAVSFRPRGLNSNTLLDNGNCFACLWINSLPVSIEIYANNAKYIKLIYELSLARQLARRLAWKQVVLLPCGTARLAVLSSRAESKAPFIWRKVVPVTRVTFLAESTLPSSCKRKKLTPLPEPRADRFSFDHALIVSPWRSCPG